MKKKDKYYCPECKKTFNELINSSKKLPGEIQEYCPHCWSKNWRYNNEK